MNFHRASTPRRATDRPRGGGALARVVRLLAVTFVLFQTAACDDAFIDPFANEGRYFTVYGYLDMLERDHAVRVIAVTRNTAIVRTPTDDAASLDAMVRSTNLTTGETVDWSYALERLDDGTYGHVFRANFLVQQANTYRLDVVRSDGATTWAVTTVPSLPEGVTIERGPVEYSADSTVLEQTLRIPSVASPWAIDASYLWGGGDLNNRLYVPYGRAGTRTGDGGWEVTLKITEDQADVRRDIARAVDAGRVPPEGPITLSAMGLRLQILDANWNPPGGVFDPDALLQPGAMSNVENGYGFFGSIGFYAQEWNTCELSGVLGYRSAPAGC